MSPRLKKIVLVCHHFIPYTPAVGGVARVWYLADYLAQQGFEVVIVSSDGYDFGDLGFPALPDSVRVIYVPDFVKRIMQRQVSVLRSEISASGFRRRSMVGLKKLVGVFAFPDFAVFALPLYYKRIKEVLQEGDVGAMLISAPSHSLLLLAILFSKKRRFGIKILADYRDGWNARGIFSRKGFLSSWLSRRLEGVVCESIDYALFATKSMRLSTGFLFPVLESEGKSFTVMNGYPENLSREVVGDIVHSPAKFRVGYFGVVNDQIGSYRNIEPILAALNVMKCRGFDFILELYGDVRVSRVDLSSYDFISVKGSISHAEALKLMKSMDCLLMYHMEREGAREVVTGKFFDYVSACRPILCVSPRDMEGAVMVEEGGFGKVADFEDVEGVGKAFSEIYNGDFLMSSESVSDFSRESQYSKILPLLI